MVASSSGNKAGLPDLSRDGPAEHDPDPGVPGQVVHEDTLELCRDVLGHLQGQHPVVDLERLFPFLKISFLLFQQTCLPVSHTGARTGPGA